ncbi:MAG TPA: ATP-binding protein [Steroidobacteraceae bacterium]|nr:ATP-binding protein [Steroidobacteraceae bacterium]
MIEDNPGDARLLQEMLRESSSVKLELTHHGCMKDALTHLSTKVANIVLLDLGLPDAMGIAAVREMHAVAPRIPLVVLTGLDDEAVATEALHEGAQDYLIKGQIQAQALLRSLRYAIERKRMEVETDQVRKLQLQLRDDFISTVSHELRTPLTSIRGALGLIDAGVLGMLPEKAATMVKIAHQNSERLVRIINDILDVEKIKSGGLEMRTESVRVMAFLQQALAVNQAYGVKYQVQFVLEDTPASMEVAADPDRLMQVMANLLSNAAKFSPAGSTVQVRTIARGTHVRIEIEDRGTGIPEEFRQHVFEKFAQADSSTSRHFEGTGLGLSITRQLLEAMGGTIGFTSITGQGTTFYFELPQAGQTLQLAPAVTQSDTQTFRAPIFTDKAEALQERTATPRILHVEDDEDLSHVLEMALAGNAEVVLACTLRAAEALLREENFSLLVLDMGLPDGTGLSLLERLPSLVSQPLPVVILSASEVARDVQQRVAATLVKSRVSEAHIVHTILSLVERPDV